MGSKKLRIISAFVLFAAALAVTGLVAPGAIAAPGDYQITFAQQPTHAKIGELITALAFDPSGGAGANQFVQVRVRQELEGGGFQDIQGASVTFQVATGSGLATPETGQFHASSRLTNADGFATFGTTCDFPTESCDPNPLWIGTANETVSTDYKVVPVVTIGATTITGTASNGFDIWEDGCRGKGCSVSLRDGEDTYVTQENVGMGATEVNDSADITCKGQRKIFGNDLFFHKTTSSDGTDAVKLTSFITAADFRAAGTNFGQAHVDWCVGLESAAKWRALGVKPTTQTFGGTTFFVALAPKCPGRKMMPPCILSRSSDGAGGAIVAGWLPGGDPPRRT